MDFKTAHTLNALTSDFYGRCAASFAQTRTRPWRGWERCINAIPDALAKPELSILDLGCGTLRFEDFLQANTRARLNIYAVDACPQLLGKDHDVHFIDMDIVSRLWDGTLRSCLRDVPECDMSCAFGLMHHIPGTQARQALLDAMVEKTKSQGYTIVSFWQFERDARLARKARETTQYALERYPTCSLTKVIGCSDGRTSPMCCATAIASQMPRLTRSSVTWSTRRSSSSDFMPMVPTTISIAILCFDVYRQHAARIAHRAEVQGLVRMAPLASTVAPRQPASRSLRLALLNLGSMRHPHHVHFRC